MSDDRDSEHALKRAKDKEREKDKKRETNGEERSSKKEHKSKDKRKDDERSKSRRSPESDRHKDRERQKDRDRERDRDRDRDRERDRERDKDRDREREREKAREREKDRERDRDKDRKDRSRRRERSRRSVSRSLSRSRSRSASSDEGREGKRRRHGEKSDKADVQDKGKDAANGQPPPTKTAKELEEERKADEQSKLEAEMDKRRKRIEAWQAQKRKENEEAELKAELLAQQSTSKTFNLDDDADDDDDDEDGNDADEDTAMDDGNETEATAANEGDDEAEDEIDPLDAFMSANLVEADAQLKAVESQAPDVAPAPEDDEVEDPLDKMMIDVGKVKKDDDDDEIKFELKPKIIPAAPSGKGGIKIAGFSFAPLTVKTAAAAPTKETSKKVKKALAAKKKARSLYGRGLSSGLYADSEEESSSEDDEDNKGSDDDETWKSKALSGTRSKSEKLGNVDHDAMEYAPFRKNFYIEAPEIAKMDVEAMKKMRMDMDGCKVRGKNVPKPIKSWTQCGLSHRILDTIKRSGFEKPLPIQAQALPAIMSGRDCIGIAKTGSGKTLAFVLPMLRHVKDQPELAQGDGMIGLIMAPTRELVQQIAKEAKAFAKPLGITVVPVYGGSGVAQQISLLKRGAEIVVATPGRLIDILATGTGKITNLRRVTYLVLDEADRMFDMGFEPQVDRVVMNTRPDRQSVLFSATFPHQVEILAKKVLKDPVEILVGGRSVVNSDIQQLVEIRPEEERFLRMLEILGEWYERGKVLVFVHSQEKCDTIFRDLLKAGYPCLSLHGGKDQSDRESTVKDFKGDVCNVLIATSVAARGLDVKDLQLVVNYDVPNHLEDYVHRVGRTGRAGEKGTAITFISQDEERYAPDLVRALTESSQPIPRDLQQMADSFNKKKKEGTVQAHGSGYGGTGFKFDTEEEEKRKAARKAQAKEFGYGGEAGEGSESDSEDDTIVQSGTKQGAAAAASGGVITAETIAQAARDAAARAQAGGMPMPMAMASALALGPGGRLNPIAAAGMAAAAAATQNAQKLAQAGTLSTAVSSTPSNPLLAAAQAAANAIATGSNAILAARAATSAPAAESAAKAAAFAAALNLAHAKGQNLATAGLAMEQQEQHFESELEINDFPQHARWKVTHKDALNQISEWTGAAITTRGAYFGPKAVVPVGERKLFLLIEGPTESSVKKAKQQIKDILESTVENMTSLPGHRPTGKYSIM